MNLARLCARLKSVFLSKKGPSKARLYTKMSLSEELGTLPMLLHRPGFGATMTMVSLALVTPDAGSKKKNSFSSRFPNYLVDLLKLI